MCITTNLIWWSHNYYILLIRQASAFTGSKISSTTPAVAAGMLCSRCLLECHMGQVDPCRLRLDTWQAQPASQRISKAIWLPHGRAPSGGRPPGQSMQPHGPPGMHPQAMAPRGPQGFPGLWSPWKRRPHSATTGLTGPCWPYRKAGRMGKICCHSVGLNPC